MRTPYLGDVLSSKTDLRRDDIVLLPHCPVPQKYVEVRVDPLLCEFEGLLLESKGTCSIEAEHSLWIAGLSQAFDDHVIQRAPAIREVPLLLTLLVETGRDTACEVEGAELLHLVVDVFEEPRVQRVVALREERHRHRGIEVEVVLLRPGIVVVPGSNNREGAETNHPLALRT